MSGFLRTLGLSSLVRADVDLVVTAQGMFVLSGGTSICSLSPRERVRVRGNATFEPRTRCGIVAGSEEAFWDGAGNRTVPSPSPLPSPLGRGSTFGSEVQNKRPLRPSKAIRTRVDLTVNARGRFVLIGGTSRCSLSPRERVRVRGNAIFEPEEPLRNCGRQRRSVLGRRG